MNQPTPSNKTTRWIVVISIPVVLGVIAIVLYFAWVPALRVKNTSTSLAKKIIVKCMAGSEEFVVTIPELAPGETFVIRRNGADFIVTDVSYQSIGRFDFFPVEYNITPTEKVTLLIQGKGSFEYSISQFWW